jgi:hypothetical protein
MYLGAAFLAATLVGMSLPFQGAHKGVNKFFREKLQCFAILCSRLQPFLGGSTRAGHFGENRW